MSQPFLMASRMQYSWSGYRCNRYESLSEIARLITGTRWSGPLFFGLKGRAIKNSKEAA